MTISIGELQRNISILKKLKEPLIVVDKRTNKEIARIEPIKKEDDMKILDEIINNSIKSDIYVEDIDEAFDKVFTEYVKEKYGNSH